MGVAVCWVGRAWIRKGQGVVSTDAEKNPIRSEHPHHNKA